MHPLLERLKQRKLVQWALAYVAGAGVLYSTLDGPLRLWGVTDGQLRIVQVLLVVGFFIAVTLAWYHGERGEQRISGPELLVIAGLMGLGAIGVRLTTEGPAPVTRSAGAGVDHISVRLPSGQSIVDPKHLDIAPDGSFIVYHGRAGLEGSPQLLMRRWDLLQATPVPGTVGASYPSISPDQTQVAFHRAIEGGEWEIVVVDLFSGASRRVMEGRSVAPTWSHDGDWLYFEVGGSIRRIPTLGGESEPVVTAGPNENQWDLFELPGGRRAVYTAERQDRMEVVDLESGATDVIGPGWRPEYSQGHLIYVAGESLVARPFDVRRAEFTGPEFTLAEGLRPLRGNAVPFAVSESGVVVYVVEPPLRYEFVWVDRGGSILPVDEGWSFDTGGPSAGWSLSPSGTMVAFRGATRDGTDIWVKSLETNEVRQITVHPGDDRWPVWLDDRTVAFLSDRGGDGRAVWSVPIDGSSEPSLLFTRPGNEVEPGPNKDEIIVRTGATAERAQDLWRATPDSTHLLNVSELEAVELGPALSPDGQWLAYTSDRTGRTEVWISSYPEGDVDRQVSVSGGFKPRWSPKGDELFFVSDGGFTEMMDSDDAMYSVSVSTDAGLRLGSPTELFPIDSRLMTNAARNFYAVSRDGTRFLMAREIVTEGAAEIVRLQNFHLGPTR